MDSQKPTCLKCGNTLPSDDAGNVCYSCYQVQQLTETADKLYKELQDMELERETEADFNDYAMTSDVYSLPITPQGFELYLNLKYGKEGVCA